MSFQVYQAKGLRIYTGDTATVNSYVGLAGELAINTETKAVRILDGINPGGVPLSTAGGAELQGLNIEQLANLLVSSPQDGQALVYEGGKWKNKAVAAADSGGASHMNQLVDVKLTNLQTGEALTYNASISKWENKSLALSSHDHDSKYQLKGNYLSDTSNLGEMNNVQITMPEDGQSLVYDAGYQKWVNTTASGGSSLSGITTDSIVQIAEGKTTHRYSGTNHNWTNLKDWLKCEITTKTDNPRIILSTAFNCRADDPTTVAFRWTREEDGVWTELDTGTDFSSEWDYAFATANTNAPYWPFTVAHEYIDKPNVPAGTKLTYFLKYRDYGGGRLVHINGTSNTAALNTDRGGGVASIIAKEIAESSAVAAEITSPENGQALVYQDGKWINSMVAGGTGDGFGGCVLQVKHEYYTEAKYTSSTSWMDAQTVSFTPKSANSRILIQINYFIEGQGAVALFRDGTDISPTPSSGQNYMFWQGNATSTGWDSGTERQTMSLMSADSPNTTDPVEYKTKISCYDTVFGVNGPPTQYGNINFSSMTIWEIGDESELGGGGSAVESYFSGIRNVKQAFKSDTWGTDSNDFVDIPGLEVTITPESADSEVFVMMDLMVNASFYCGEVQLVRNGEYIAQGDEAGVRPRSTIIVGIPPSTDGYSQRSSSNFLDKPNTTEPVTYKLVGRGRKDDQNNGALYVNRTDMDRDTNTFDGRGVSSLTVMEVNNNPVAGSSEGSYSPTEVSKDGQLYRTCGYRAQNSTVNFTLDKKSKFTVSVNGRYEGGAYSSNVSQFVIDSADGTITSKTDAWGDQINESYDPSTGVLSIHVDAMTTVQKVDVFYGDLVVN